MAEAGATVGWLDGGDGRRIAFARTPGSGPEVLFLHGLRSDMGGSKALFLEARCRERGRAFTRFDARGHGRSGGRFEEGTIGRWLEDALLVLDRAVRGPAVLVGSSMGGWLALLCALRRPGRVAGLVGIAAAPDFTERLIEPALPPEARAALARDGVLAVPSAYGEPWPLTRGLLEDGRAHAVLRAPSLAIAVPVHLLHGQADAEVPWALALELAAKIEGGRVTVELVKDGDHRLSREEDLRRIAAALERVVEQAGAGTGAVPGGPGGPG